MAALALAALAPLTSYGAIAGTAHDLSAKAWGSTETCVFCHTPHNAKAAQIVPLWNHTATAATFTLYTSSTLTATVGQPAGISKACLSCHDGTVAMDSFGANAGTHMMTGAAMVGTNLSDDHPISFTYDTALATSDAGLVSPASTSFVDAAHSVPLFAGKMECASCHDVHNNTSAPFLRKSNNGSALCLTCHNK
jgi:predicted CXXCH cytochrome family protein